MIKVAVRKLLSSAWLSRAWAPLTRGRVALFTLHRFAVPDTGVRGHDLTLLRRALERLRRERYHLLALEEAIRRLAEGGEIPDRAVVFTVDDGYADFAQVGAEIFLAYDCPVTVFLTTGFLDGALWQWWDRIAYVLETTRTTSLDLALAGTPIWLELATRGARARAAAMLGERCTTVGEEAKQRFIRDLSAAAQVEIPARPPARYAPMSWAEAQALELRGIRFGPHTVTHPVLVHVPAERSAWEIEASWSTLRERLARPLPVFCYPNGDFGRREAATVARLGLDAALTTTPAYASVEAFRHPEAGPYAVPRFPYPEHPDPLCLTASGFTRVSDFIRRTARAAWS